MDTKAKTGLAGTRSAPLPRRAKKTRQGHGQHSKASHGRKLPRGQG